MWIKGGKVIDPAQKVLKKRDILIERGRIKKLFSRGGFDGQGPRLKIIDASGMIVIPGLIDMHVHLREPGHEYKETIASGSRAGVAGGFTALACMPNTNPVNDSSAVTEFMIKQAGKAKLSRLYPIGAITKGQAGETLTEFGDLREAGAVGLSDDGFPVLNSEVMRRALEYAPHHGLTVISHAEDTTLSAGGSMHEGTVSTRIGLKGIPAESEEIMVFREISLAKLTGCPVHIAHVSTAGAADLIRRAKEADIPVTAETAPHYFSLDHRAVIGYNTHAKMNPPLRTREDVLAIREALADGTIDVIAGDHAPHSPLEKEVEFDKAAFGIIGLETVLPLTLALVREDVLTLPAAIKKLSLNPAAVLGVEGGSIREGAPADLAIIDPNYEYVFTPEMIQSKSKNSPFIGQTMKGINLLTVVGGRVVWKRKTEHFSG